MLRAVIAALAVAACADPPTHLKVDVIVRGMTPPRLDFSNPPEEFPVFIEGANFCDQPQLRIGSTVLVAESNRAGTSIEFSRLAVQRALLDELFAHGDCGEAMPVEVVVDCTGQFPLQGGTYGLATGRIVWEVGLFTPAATTVHETTQPTSRAARILVEVVGDIPGGVLASSIDFGGVDAETVQDDGWSGDDNLEGWFAVRPLRPLAPGQTWTITLKSGLRGLHTQRHCLDFDGERAITITARDEETPTFRMRVVQEDPLVVEADEMGAPEYELRERHVDDAGHMTASLRVARSTTPHFEWQRPNPHRRSCLKVTLPGMPEPSVTDETCLEPR